MGATNSPLPIYRADMFEFGQEEAPLHANRNPVAHNGSTWGLEGILAPHLEDAKTVLATNIEDRATLHLLFNARLSWLRREFGGVVSGDEVKLLMPRDEALPLYTHGVSVGDEMQQMIMAGAATEEIFRRAEEISRFATPSPVIDRVIKEGVGLQPVSLPTAPAVAAA